MTASYEWWKKAVFYQIYPRSFRDTSRTPMQWSDEKWAVFSPPDTQKTWFQITEEFQEINLKKQLNDPDSISSYQDLLELRKSHPALQTGDYHSLPDTPNGCNLCSRHNEEEKLLIAIKFTSQQQIFDLSHMPGGKLLLSSLPERERTITTPFILRPNESILV